MFFFAHQKHVTSNRHLFFFFFCAPKCYKLSEVKGSDLWQLSDKIMSLVWFVRCVIINLHQKVDTQCLKWRGALRLNNTKLHTDISWCLGLVELVSWIHLHYSELQRNLCTCWWAWYTCIRNIIYLKSYFCFRLPWRMGRDTSLGIATCYGLGGPGIESRWGARFSATVQSGPVAHPASYTMGTGSLLRVKCSGRGVNHSPPSSTEVEERVELYICSPSGLSWPVLGWTLPVPFFNVILEGSSRPKLC
jgi:hypothetical protein